MSMYTAISIKVLPAQWFSPSKAEKSNTSAKGFLGVAKKIRSDSRSYCIFLLCSGITSIEIAVYCMYHVHQEHLKPLTDEQIFYDTILCDKFYLLDVCTRNFDNFFYDKCTCSKASMLAFEQVHLS